MKVHHDPRRQQSGSQAVLLFPDGLQTQPRRAQHKGQREHSPHQSGIGHGLQQVVVGILGLILEGLHRAAQIFRGAKAPAQQRRCGEDLPRVLVIFRTQVKAAAHAQEQTVGNECGQ